MISNFSEIKNFIQYHGYDPEAYNITSTTTFDGAVHAFKLPDLIKIFQEIVNDQVALKQKNIRQFADKIQVFINIYNFETIFEDKPLYETFNKTRKKFFDIVYPDRSLSLEEKTERVLLKALPIDILKEIFCWLSKEDLIQIRNVCKSLFLPATEVFIKDNPNIWKKFSSLLMNLPIEISTYEDSADIKNIICFKTIRNLAEILKKHAEEVHTLTLVHPYISYAQFKLIVKLFPNLKTLTIINRSLNVVVNAFNLFSSLQKLKIYYSSIGGSEFQRPFSHLTQLQKLLLHSSRVSEYALGNLPSSLQKLKILDCDHIKGEDLQKSLPQLTQLRELSISGSDTFSDDVFGNLPPSLRELNICGINIFRCGIHKSLPQLTQLQKFETVCSTNIISKLFERLIPLLPESCEFKIHGILL